VASGRSSGPRAGAQNVQPVHFHESHEFLLKTLGPGSGRALTLSRFVGRTGRPGPKSGDDWFFIKKESSPDLGPEPQAQIPLDKGVPQIIGPTCLSCLLNASARVGYAVFLFARALLFSLLDLRTGTPGLFHVFLVVLAILRRYRTAQHAIHARKLVTALEYQSACVSDWSAADTAFVDALNGKAHGAVRALGLRARSTQRIQRASKRLHSVGLMMKRARSKT